MFHGLNSLLLSGGEARRAKRLKHPANPCSKLRMVVFTGLAGMFPIIGRTRTKRKKGVRISLRNVHKLLQRKDFLTVVIRRVDTPQLAQKLSILSNRASRLNEMFQLLNIRG